MAENDTPKSECMARQQYSKTLSFPKLNTPSLSASAIVSSQIMGRRKTYSLSKRMICECILIKPNAGQIRAKKCILFQLLNGREIKLPFQIELSKCKDINRHYARDRVFFANFLSCTLNVGCCQIWGLEPSSLHPCRYDFPRIPARTFKSSLVGFLPVAVLKNTGKRFTNSASSNT